MTNALKVVPRGDREIIMTRVFEAPPAVVFDALTRPELVQRWLLGPDGWSMPVCEMDLRPGGKYRWEWTQDNGEGGRLVSTGTFHEIEQPDRIVQTQAYEGMPGEALMETVLTEEEGGRTKMTITIDAGSREARDAWVASGMESGAGRSYDRLDAMVATMGAA